MRFPAPGNIVRFFNPRHFNPRALVAVVLASTLHKVFLSRKPQRRIFSTAKQEASLALLCERLPSALQSAGCGSKATLWGVTLSSGSAEDPQAAALLRQFLQARKYHVEKTAKMIEGTLRWRREYGVERLKAEDFADLPTDEIAPQADADGHTVVTLRLGAVPKSAFVNRARYLQWRLCMQEAGLRSLALGREDAARPGYVYVLDCEGLKAFHVSKAARRCATDLTKVMMQCYPDYLKGTHIVNTPKFVAATWAVFRQILPVSFSSGVKVHTQPKSLEKPSDTSKYAVAGAAVAGAAVVAARAPTSSVVSRVTGRKQPSLRDTSFPMMGAVSSK